MNLCSHKHAEICYEGDGCPLCTALSDLRDSERTVEEKDKEIDTLSNEKTDLEREVQELNDLNR